MHTYTDPNKQAIVDRAQAAIDRAQAIIDDMRARRIVTSGKLEYKLCKMSELSEEERASIVRMENKPR
jgi:hypothetical protein